MIARHSNDIFRAETKGAYAAQSGEVKKQVDCSLKSRV